MGTRLQSEPDSPTALDRHDRVAAGLRESLLALARDFAGQAVRPSRLVERLGIDKSLASRLVRSLRVESTYELLHHIPSPPGLRLFLDAAQSQGTDPALLARARGAVESFQDMLEDFPGGRSALDALISESVVEVRQRAERTAAQGIYRSMSYLLGFHCAAVSSAIILQPSANGTTVDGIDVNRREAIRRVRPSAPVALFSVNLEAARPNTPRIDTLEGLANPSDPMSLLLPAFCDPAKPAVEVIQSNGHTIFALSSSEASLHRAVTVSSAFIIRDGWNRHLTEEQFEEGRTYLLHYPCKLLIRDLYIRDDLWVGAEPRIRLEFPSPAGQSLGRFRNFPERLNTLDMAAPIEHLGPGLRNSAVAGMPEHARLVTHAFEASGWDPTRFRAYRVRISYPVPMITMGWWIPLAPKS